MKRFVLASLSVVGLLTVAVPSTVAFNHYSDDAHQENFTSFSDRWRKEREETLNATNDRWRKEREETLNATNDRWRKERQETLNA